MLAGLLRRFSLGRIDPRPLRAFSSRIAGASPQRPVPDSSGLIDKPERPFRSTVPSFPGPVDGPNRLSTMRASSGVVLEDDKKLGSTGFGSRTTKGSPPWGGRGGRMRGFPDIGSAEGGEGLVL
jgi:hypothetical protein